MEIWILGGVGGYSPTSDLDLGKKLEIWIWWGGVGGYSPTSDLDLGKKVGNLDLGGVFSNFGFGLRKKSWKFGFWGGYSPTSDLDLGKKLEIWIGGGILQLWIWT